jgi:hypothetical protein
VFFVLRGARVGAGGLVRDQFVRPLTARELDERDVPWCLHVFHLMERSAGTITFSDTR